MTSKPFEKPAKHIASKAEAQKLKETQKETLKKDKENKENQKLLQKMQDNVEVLTIMLAAAQHGEHPLHGSHAVFGNCFDSVLDAERVRKRLKWSMWQLVLDSSKKQSGITMEVLI
ncbi:hypothetical protein BDR26DRAFT_914448 [Obelidium mucronatum]|nr:hypothetical protein BDR26DRAFT_914448 [Obelidium mucronatum]